MNDWFTAGQSGTWRAQGEPHSPDCRWCGGGRAVLWVGPTTAYAYVTCLHACAGCDSSERGDGSGPPSFAALWGEKESGRD